MRGQALASLRAERDSAQAMARRGLLKVVFPSDHPYCLPVDGSEATVQALERGDLIGFHRDRYRPDRAVWVVAGDVEPEDVARQLDQVLSGWEGAARLERPLPEPRPTPTPRILLIDRPGAPQAVVQVGHLGLPRRHPDFTDLMVFNQILGGQFSSRLNETLREEMGYTYGIRSQFDCRRSCGLFSISASLESARLAEALIDLKREVTALLGDRPPSESELDDARRSLIEGQARHFETPSALVARFGGLFLHDLPPDEHRHLPDRLGAVSVGSALKAGQQHIQPGSFVYVVVADADLVQPALEGLGWGAVERWTREEI